MSRVDVRKTHKLFIGGAFPRSESGRTYEVTDSKEQFLANMALASRKDARDAGGFIDRKSGAIHSPVNSKKPGTIIDPSLTTKWTAMHPPKRNPLEMIFSM